MMKFVLLAGVAIATSLTFSADQADAFGGRGYARRHARRAHYVAAPVVRHHRVPVVRHYHAPVVRHYRAPVVSYYRAPVYHAPPVSVHVGGYRSYYGGVSIGIGW